VVLERVVGVSEFDRVRWRCRRGLLELDIVLSRFLETGYAALPPQQRRVFSELLELPDNELWDLITGRALAAAPAEEAVLERLRAA
jgi:antitoxin CptB